MAKRVKNLYTNNTTLRADIQKTKDQGRVTNELAKAIMLIASGMGRKGNWAGYSWREEMEGEAIVHMVKGATGYDETKSNNPFGYLSMIAHNAFLRVLKEHKRQGDIRDDLAFAAGAPTSFARLDREAA